MSWYIEKCGEDSVIIQNGFRLQNRSGEHVGPVLEVSTGKNDDTIMFKCRGEGRCIKYSRSTLLSPGPSRLSALLSQTSTNQEFVSVLIENSNITQSCSNAKRKAGVEQVSPKRIRMPDVRVEVTSETQESQKLSEADKETESCCVGKFEVPIMTLSAPPDDMMCRAINRGWVETLKAQIKTSPTHIYVTLPCIIKSSQVPNVESFEEDKLDLYTVYTLGGNHLRTALQELLEENDSSDFEHIRKVGIHLYIGLSSHQARRLGSLHNKKTETYQPSLFDKVTLSRKILYEMSGKELNDGEPPQISAEWKLRCQVELAEENKTINTLSTVFHMAHYSLRCWGLLCRIQNRNTSMSKPLTQTVFQKFQGLSEAYRFELLTKVSMGLMTLDEAGSKAQKSKKMELIRSTFNHLTKSSSWSEAKGKFPDHTQEETLERKFLGMKWERKTIPTEFVMWCRDATENSRNANRGRSLSVEINIFADGESLCSTEIDEIKNRYKSRILGEIGNLQGTQPCSETCVSNPETI